MDTQQPRYDLSDLQFRVLIVGRANAGKTSILQRVCETTDSPTIRRGNEEIELKPSMNRGEHDINDEIVFSNHEGYVFHDSRGIESGSIDELQILQEFIKSKSGEKMLRDRLHAIWYCVPMDGHRPGLDLKFYKDICPDNNVPVIALFTKYDQYRLNVEMDVLDDPDKYDGRNETEEAEQRFQEYYLRPLGDNVSYVRLENMHMKESRCDELIEKSAAALNEDAVALMLLAVQKGNLELSVKMALNRVYAHDRLEAEDIIRKCLFPFPVIWYFTKTLNNLSSKNKFGLDLELEEGFFKPDSSIMNPTISYMMSMPTIQNLTITDFNHHHLILAVILILRHATFLCLSNLSSQDALTQVELAYQQSNIDLKIQQYLTVCSQEHPVEISAAFIMANDIVPSRTSVKTQV